VYESSVAKSEGNLSLERCRHGSLWEDGTKVGHVEIYLDLTHGKHLLAGSCEHAN
jgi:hypothetical protein